MLKAAAKTAYMREYMRRRRAAGQAAAAMIDALRRELAAAKARIQELEVRGKQPEAGAVAEDEIAGAQVPHYGSGAGARHRRAGRPVLRDEPGRSPHGRPRHARRNARGGSSLSDPPLTKTLIQSWSGASMSCAPAVSRRATEFISPPKWGEAAVRLLVASS